MTKLGPTFGLARQGTIRRYNSNGTMSVSINLAKTDSINPVEVIVPLLAAWAGPNGEFSGGFPPVGATVWVAMGQGGDWCALNYAPSSNLFGSSSSSSKNFQSKLSGSTMTSLKAGRYLTQVRNDIKIVLDPDTGIQLGNANSSLQLDPSNSISVDTYNQQLDFSEAHRSIKGPVKRDLNSNITRNVAGSALTSTFYDRTLTTIGLDPKTKIGNSFYRNPPFSEERSVTYEFSNSFGYTNDQAEAAIYDSSELPEVTTKFNRRISRADTLSLNLIAPNQLIESTKGTVVDIYGNILDINRYALPNGKIDSLSFRNSENDKSDTFTSLREQSRKSVALHFELNARKKEIQEINDPKDYARGRSRLSLDVDKEGQFKLNIPMSSETGNISLLTRYENYSTLKALQDKGNPNEFVRNIDEQDVFQEGFGAQSIGLVGGDDSLQGFVAPVDRITGKQIKLGTAYHDISNSLQLHRRAPAVLLYTDSKLNDVTLINPVVTDTVTVSGSKANAGGRSGTISLDGSLAVSLGANTVDRQSLWLDCAGGIVTNVGRDRNGISFSGTMDGHVLMQIGGATISNDSRFEGENNALKDGVFDMRVVTGALMHIIRIDKSGIRIHSPGEIDIVSESAMRFKSVRNSITFDAESIFLYADNIGTGRLINRQPGMTI
jgi:hypothetical protein